MQEAAASAGRRSSPVGTFDPSPPATGSASSTASDLAIRTEAALTRVSVLMSSAYTNETTDGKRSFMMGNNSKP